jgi:beta-xylosidase
MESRRDALKLALLGGLGLTGSLAEARGPTQERSANLPSRGSAPRWGRGVEGQRIADLGDGRYLNPIMAGDHPDRTVLKDGNTYYMTFSSFDGSALSLRHLFLRIVNDEHIVTMYYSENGTDWTRHGLRIETSGYNTNTIDDLLSLRPALFAVGKGEVRFRNFAYRALR